MRVEADDDVEKKRESKYLPYDSSVKKKSFSKIMLLICYDIPDVNKEIIIIL